MCIGMDGKLVGVFTLTDKIRADANATIAHLQRRGYAVHMLSGTSFSDNAPLIAWSKTKDECRSK